MNFERGSYLFEWDVYNIVDGVDQHVIVSEYRANSIVVEKRKIGVFQFFAKGHIAVDKVVVDPNVPFRSAISYSPSAIYGSHNGNLRENVGTLPLAPSDRFQVGWDKANPDTYLFGHIRRITYWNHDLKPAQLMT